MKHSFTLLQLVLILLPILSSAFDRSGQVEKNAKVEQDPCNLTAQAGNCLAYFPRWYYEAQADLCLQFVYGGCGGNANRFVTRQECSKFRYRCLRKRGFPPGRIPPLRDPPIIPPNAK